MFEKIVEFKNDHRDLYDLCINDFAYDSVYENLGKFKKGLYLLLVDRTRLIQRVKEKLTNNKKNR
jgi:hypothetical protein